MKLHLAQTIRNAYEWRDRDALEHALRHVEQLESMMSFKRVKCPRCRHEFGAYIYPSLRVECPRCKSVDAQRAYDSGHDNAPSYTFLPDTSSSSSTSSSNDSGTSSGGGGDFGGGGASGDF